MSWNESVEPVLATTLVAVILPIPFYLLWMHALQGLWRRIGRASYVLHVALYATMVTWLVRLHPLWSQRALPWPTALAWLSIVPFAIALWLIVESYRTIDWRTLHQVRQLVPGTERRIIRDGILGRVRHPRYVAFSLVAFGNALMTGYPFVAAAGIVAVALLALVVRIEENELRSVFGDEFERYRREVPAFIPRLFASRASDAPKDEGA